MGDVDNPSSSVPLSDIKKMGETGSRGETNYKF
jgi:hypothetical protein